MRKAAAMVVLIGLIVLLAYLYQGYSAKMKAAQLRAAALHPLLAETALGPVEYAFQGDGPVVLISHGVTGGIEQCFGLANMYLPKDKLCILAVSRFGYGGSSLPGAADPARQADAFAALLDELKIQKAHLLGNSAGGAAALQFAIRHPNRCASLSLVSANVPNPAKLPPKPFMRILFGSDFLYWMTIRFFGKPLLAMGGIPAAIRSELSEKEQNQLIEDVLFAPLPIHLRTEGILNDTYVSNLDMAKGYDLSKVTSPTLMIHAKDDPLPPFRSAEIIAGKIPGCRFMPIERGGHLLLGNEKQVQEAIYNMISAAEHP